MDSKAVSPLIGFVLLLAIIMGLIGIMQSQWVPVWNKQVEAKHLDRLSYEVADMSEAISMAAQTGSPAKVVFESVEYPNYYILFSPSKSAVSVSSIPLKVKLSGTINGESLNKDFTTHAIVIQPQYFYSQRSKLLYEHSAVIKFYGNAVVPKLDQTSFTKDSVNLYIVNTTFNSLSMTDSLNLAYYPVSYGGINEFKGDITFECYNSETAKLWNETLAKIYGGSNVERDGRNVTIRNADIHLSLNYGIVSLNSAEVVTHTTASHLKPLLNTSVTYEIPAGQTKDFGVQVLDEYWNPVRDAGELSRVSVSGCDNVYYQDSEVWCTADSSGDVKFSLGSETVTYTVEITHPSGGAGIFDISWLNGTFSGDHYYFGWDASTGNPKNFVAKVKYNSNPVAYAPVYFSTDNPSLIDFNPTFNQTDNNGKALVKVTANDNGTANLIATCGGSSSVLKLDIWNVTTFCPAGWQYYRVITLNPETPVNYFQVKIVLDSSFDYSHANSDGSDIRFYDTSWNPLPYWIEKWNEGGESVIWVKVPNAGTNRIYMFYGNSSASSKSNGAAVFDFFDDFETFNTSKWTAYSTNYDISGSVLTIRKGGIERKSAFPFRFQDGYVAETKVKFLNLGGRRSYSGVIPEIASSPYTASSNRNRDATILYMREYRSYSVCYWIGDGRGSGYDRYGCPWVSTNGEWYITGVSVLGNEVKFWKDYMVEETVTGINWNKDLVYIKLGSFYRDESYNIQDTSYDWVRVRKYADSEPTASIGDEQSC